MCLLTSDSIGGSPPASNNNTFQFSFSLKRLATTEPADPAPTTIKSYSSNPNKDKKKKRKKMKYEKVMQKRNRNTNGNDLKNKADRIMVNG